MPTPLDDREIIAKFLAGDSEAYHLLRQWITAVLRAGYLDRGIAHFQDDIMQDALSSLFKNLRDDKFLGQSSLKTYAQKTTQKLCLKWRYKYREQDRQSSLEALDQEPVHPGEDPHQAAESAEREKQWGDAIRQLSHECQQLFQMIWEEQKPYRDIAARLETTEVVIKQRAHRCKQRLIERLAKSKAGGVRVS